MPPKGRTTMTYWNLGTKLLLSGTAAALAAIGIGTGHHTGSKILHGLRSYLANPGGDASEWQPAANANPPRSALPMQIGVNMPGIAYYGTAVPFANLAKGGGWHLNWGAVPAGDQDSEGRLLGSGPEKVYRLPILVPTSAPDNYRVACTWTGSGRMTGSAGPKTVASEPGHLTMVFPKPLGRRASGWIEVTGVVRERPLSNLDCRGSDSPPNARFRPGFMRALRGYTVLRFMDWQNSNSNPTVTWATRHTPASIRMDQDGVSVEDMMDIANSLGADPWFVVPWNGDDDYVTHFATMVRDRLPAGHHVYVETGNEVWNTQFAVTKQAQAEGLGEGLSKDPMRAGLMRYAEKTIHVMTIWEKVFAGHPGLVRVASSQSAWSVPLTIVFGFPKLPDHVDALATAPYFGFVMGGKNLPYQLVVDKTGEALAKTMRSTALNRAVAQHYHKRFITYEGGQGTELFADPDTMRKFQTSQDMYEFYKRYLSWWRQDNGDLLMLYNAISPIAAGGAWGQAEYETDTPATAPKLRAIVEERSLLEHHPS